MGGERVGKRRKAGVKRAPGRAQRLLRLQHHGEFGEVEAADMNERAGALVGRDCDRMSESVADLAQRDGAERRRQIEAGRERGAHANFELSGISPPDSSFASDYNYNGRDSPASAELVGKMAWNCHHPRRRMIQ